MDGYLNRTNGEHARTLQNTQPASISGLPDLGSPILKELSYNFLSLHPGLQNFLDIIFNMVSVLGNDISDPLDSHQHPCYILTPH